ncbi:MAG: hypothetical protein IKU81_03990, partial [Oscillibacter sp.]|nr:hypothetical protein [Oscillibacter sp.]
ATGLVTEVDACLQQGFHGYDVRCHVVCSSKSNLVITSGGFIPSANHLAQTESLHTVRNAEI